MFYCGKEEPITNNESLYQKKEGIDQLILDQSKGLSINRYSFVSKNNVSETIIPSLIRELFNQLGLRAFVIICWLVKLPGKSPVASRVIEKKYAKQGWNIHLRGDHYLAVKELLLDDINTWPPLAISPLDGGIVLMMGDCDASDVLNAMNDDCSLFLASTMYFAPDRTFLVKMEESDIVAIYQLNDDLGHVGIVLVGNRTIDTMTLNYIPIAKTFEGELAYKAFV